MDGILTTGILGLDLALGLGGLPRGQLVELYGPEKCGKTAVCLSILAQAQKSGGATAFIDTDQTLDPERAARIGIDINQVMYARPENAYQALEITRALTQSGALDLIVLDSVAGLLMLGAQGADGSGSTNVSRLLAQAVRELSVLAAETGTTLIFTNELKERAGVIYGVPVTTPGGIALKLHAALRLELTPCGELHTGPHKTGDQIRVKIVKPRSSAKFSSIIINIMYNGIVSRLDNLFDLATELGYINKQSGFYFFGRTSLGRGRQAVLDRLGEKPQLAEDIETAIRENIFPSSSAS